VGDLNDVVPKMIKALKEKGIKEEKVKEAIETA
jgi:hypothetical protein